MALGRSGAVCHAISAVLGMDTPIHRCSRAWHSSCGVTADGAEGRGGAGLDPGGVLQQHGRQARGDERGIPAGAARGRRRV